MKSVFLLTAFLGVFLAQLTLSEAISCYSCAPTDSGCRSPFVTSEHQDWLKACTSGKTCLQTINSDKTTTRTCNNQDTCMDGTTTSYYQNCFNNICTEEYCCTGDGCNSAPVAVSFSVLLTAFMVLATWAFRK
ncbi:uncharacterized protein LOC119730901 [Patiria miniata]|uniref:Uncharacterized protein n=1 Tax=Patiria miniata TaxID=46514 RepID=A0A914A7Y3_PATMI|nr:uncharacterized protein LOC119730901 [Patiria miniata]